MKKLLAILFIGAILSGCAMSSADLSVGNSYANYEKACRKLTLMRPKLVFSDGNVKGYHCSDGAAADVWRYEFFENNKLVKVWSRPVTAEERAARFNNALLGLAILNSGTATGTTTQTQQPMGFKSFEMISGFNKICFYDNLGSLNATTIPNTSLCPLMN